MLRGAERNDGVDVDIGEQAHLVEDVVLDRLVERRTMMSGWIPMPRSSLTECWAGFVFTSPVAPICGSQVTWTYRTLRRPTSLRIWRMASRNGGLRCRPPSADLDHDHAVRREAAGGHAAGPSRATRAIRSLISFVMCGMTWTVPPR